MNRLEKYLDEVCRGIAGPRAMRNHIRQELREHLLDAVAEHKATGMSEELATAKAIDDFGAPQQVGSEFESVHGHRLTALIIDKAMQWKDATMKARWFWNTMAHLALLTIIAGSVGFNVFAMYALVPAYRKMEKDGIFDPHGPYGEQFCLAWFHWLASLAREVHYHWWVGIFLLVAWIVFEWRSRTENKSFIRLSVLGGIGVITTTFASALAAMMIIVSILVPFERRFTIAEKWLRESVPEITSDLDKAESSLRQQDWYLANRLLEDAATFTEHLKTGHRMKLFLVDDQPKIDAVRARLSSAVNSMEQAALSANKKDAQSSATAIQEARAELQKARELAGLPKLEGQQPKDPPAKKESAKLAPSKDANGKQAK